MLPRITGHFGIVNEPEVKFAQSGKAWARVRCVAKDRKRGQNGEWEDGDPLFIDVIAFGKIAENLIESAQKGDSLVIDGKLSPNTWTDDSGVERRDMRIIADEIGVSLTWGTAKTQRVLESSGVAAVAETLGATEVQDESAPF